MRKPMHILIVDDDELDRRAARRALLASDLDVEVAEADRGVEAWTAGQPVVSHDYTQDQTSLDAGVRDLTRAFIACPVFLRGQFNGLFIVHQNGGPRAWTQDEVDFLSAVTDILALALENARLYAREHRVADMLQSAFLTGQS